MSVFDEAVRGSGTALVAPLIYRLAAQLEQVPVEELLDDPASAAFVLRSAQGLFGLPLLVNHLQLGLEIEAAGGELERDERGLPVAGATAQVTLSAQVPLLDAVVDVVARLSSELRRTTPVLGVLTGPATLAGLRNGSTAGLVELYAAMARRYADAGAAGVLLIERVGATPATADSLGELANICRFYGIRSILLTPTGPAPTAPVDRSLGEQDVMAAQLWSEPPSTGAAEPFARHRGLLLSSGEVPADTDPETVDAWLDALGRSPLGAVP